MFDDRFGLTDAVVDGYKTRTFRINKKLNHPLVTDISELITGKDGRAYVTITYSTGVKEVVYPKYQPGEVVAVAQNYSTALSSLDWANRLIYKDEIGWTNKMYVRADLMPHRIRITNVKCERMQDTNNEDSLREGIVRFNSPVGLVYIFYGCEKDILDRASFGRGWIKLDGVFTTPRKAFAALINKMSGEGTWEKNYWGFAYDFELIKS